MATSSGHLPSDTGTVVHKIIQSNWVQLSKIKAEDILDALIQNKVFNSINQYEEMRKQYPEGDLIRGILSFVAKRSENILRRFCKSLHDSGMEDLAKKLEESMPDPVITASVLEQRLKEVKLEVKRDYETQLQNEVHGLQKQLEDMQREISQRDKTISSLKNDLSNTVHIHAEQLTQREQQLQELQDEMKEMKKEMSDLQEQCAELMKQADADKVSLESLAAIIEQHKKEIEDRDKEIEILKKENRELQNKLYSTPQQNDRNTNMSFKPPRKIEVKPNPDAEPSNSRSVPGRRVKSTEPNFRIDSSDSKGVPGGSAEVRTSKICSIC